MVRFSLIAYAVLASVAGTAKSDCTPGVQYCGWDLLTDVTDYLDDMKSALAAGAEAANDADIIDSVFRCQSSHNSTDSLKWIQYCDLKTWSVCLSGDEDEDAYCDVVPS